jgi:hypothetical protein
VREQDKLPNHHKLWYNNATPRKMQRPGLWHPSSSLQAEEVLAAMSAMLVMQRWPFTCHNLLSVGRDFFRIRYAIVGWAQRVAHDCFGPWPRRAIHQRQSPAEPHPPATALAGSHGPAIVQPCPAPPFMLAPWSPDVQIIGDGAQPNSLSKTTAPARTAVVGAHRRRSHYLHSAPSTSASDQRSRRGERHQPLCPCQHFPDPQHHPSRNTLNDRRGLPAHCDLDAGVPCSSGRRGRETSCMRLASGHH